MNNSVDTTTPLLVLRGRATMAARTGDLEAFQLIVALPQFVHPLGGYLEVACHHGKDNIVDWLAPQINDPEAWRQAAYCTINNEIDNSKARASMLKHWPKNVSHDNFFIQAAEQGHYKAARDFLPHVSPDIIATAMTVAAAYDNSNIMELLYDHCTPQHLHDTRMRYPYSDYLKKRGAVDDSRHELQKHVDDINALNTKHKKM